MITHVHMCEARKEIEKMSLPSLSPPSKPLNILTAVRAKNIINVFANKQEKLRTHRSQKTTRAHVKLHLKKKEEVFRRIIYRHHLA